MKKIKFNQIVHFLPSCIVVTLFLFHIDLGVDITDEGLYLLSAQHANKDLIGTSHFQHYTNLLWLLAGKNIALFRAYGLFLLVVSSAFVMSSIIRYLELLIESIRISKADKVLWYSASNISVLVYYYWWLPTPSYNWLALFCCLLTLGLLLRLICLTKLNDNHISHSVVIIGVVIGLLLAIAFVAKPPTMVVLSVVAVVCIFFVSSPKYGFNVSFLIGVSAVFFFFLHTLVFEGGVFHYILNITIALEHAATLFGHDISSKLPLSFYGDLLSLPSYIFKNAQSSSYVALSIIFVNVVFCFFSLLPDKYIKRLNILLMLVTIVLAWWELNITQHWEGGIYLGRKIGFGAITLLVLVTLPVLAIRIRELLYLKSEIDTNFKYFVILIFSIIFCNFAYSLGSSNGFLRQGGGAFVFIALALIITSVWVERHNNAKWISSLSSILVVFSSFLIFKGAYNEPYRLGASLSEQQHSVTFLGTNSSLKVDLDTAIYINALKCLALENGWSENFTFIDLTGGTPLASFVLNGAPLKRAWILGAYSGSEAAARYILEQSDASEIKSSWVLTAPGGKQEINPSVLDVAGINFEEDFELVGELETAHRREKQYLWRPRTD